jgi:predicted RNase H-like HicB family nuclease
MTDPSPIHVLILQEGEWLVAQCLEHDIATQAKTVPELVYQFQSILVGHILAAKHEGTSLGDLPMAPQQYWDQWQRSNSVKAESDWMPWVPAPMLRPTELRFA